MATDMLIVKQNMMRLIATMNKTYIKPLNYYTAAECQTILDFTAARGRGGALPTGSLKTISRCHL